MTKRLIIHLGGPKTGTSALQSFLAKNRAALASNGFDYPALENLSHAENGEISSGNGVGLALHFLEPGVHDARNAFPRFVKALQASKAPNVLISSEHFTYIRPGGFERIRHEAENAGRQLELMIYIRPQIQSLISTYAQRIKRHCETASVGTYWEKNQAGFDHLPRLRSFDAAVGRDNLKVRLYLRKQLQGGDVITDFGHLYGLDFNSPAFARIPHEINPTPNLHELALLRYINRFKKVDYESGISDSLLNISRDANPPESQLQRLWLPDDLSGRITDRYRDSNREVSEHYLDGTPLEADLGRPEKFTVIDDLPEPGPMIRAMAKLYLSMFRTIHQQQRTINRLQQNR